MAKARGDVDARLRGEGDPRLREVAELYASGLTQQEVADRVGVSRQRVGQMLRRSGLPVRSKRQAQAERRQRIIEERSDAICAAFAESKNIAEVARDHRTATSIVKEIVAANFSPAERRPPKRKPWPVRFSAQELIGFLKEASRGKATVTVGDYTRYAKGQRTPAGWPWPGHVTFYKRFGSWREALVLAGLSDSSAGPRFGTRKFDERGCVDALRAAALALGKPPTTLEYDEFARSFDRTYPSAGTIRNRFGTWTEALFAAEL